MRFLRSSLNGDVRRGRCSPPPRAVRAPPRPRRTRRGRRGSGSPARQRRRSGQTAASSSLPRRARAAGDRRSRAPPKRSPGRARSRQLHERHRRCDRRRPRDDGFPNGARAGPRRPDRLRGAERLRPNVLRGVPVRPHPRAGRALRAQPARSAPTGSCGSAQATARSRWSSPWRPTRTSASRADGFRAPPHQSGNEFQSWGLPHGTGLSRALPLEPEAAAGLAFRATGRRVSEVPVFMWATVGIPPAPIVAQCGYWRLTLETPVRGTGATSGAAYDASAPRLARGVRRRRHGALRRARRATGHGAAPGLRRPRGPDKRPDPSGLGARAGPVTLPLRTDSSSSFPKPGLSCSHRAGTRSVFLSRCSSPDALRR